MTNKFDHVVSALGEATVEEITEFFLNPPESGKYKFLKAEILNHLTLQASN